MNISGFRTPAKISNGKLSRDFQTFIVLSQSATPHISTVITTDTIQLTFNVRQTALL
jgi:hypothetical protein